jgi:hypothetical protein
LTRTPTVVKYEKMELAGKYGVGMLAGLTKEKSTLASKLPEMFWVLQREITTK